MKRNCCECSAEAVLYSDSRLFLGHAHDERINPFFAVKFSCRFPPQKPGKSATFQTAHDRLEAHPIAFSTGTSIAKAKGLQSALWKRRTKVYRKKQVGDFSSHVRTGSHSGWLGSSFFSWSRLPAPKSIRVLCPVKSLSNRARAFLRKLS